MGGGRHRFTLGNSALIITGALVGSSGAILSYIMCKGMNRILLVILGGFGGEVAGGRGRRAAAGQARLGGGCRLPPENSSRVIIVPGYGMAVAQAHGRFARWGTS